MSHTLVYSFIFNPRNSFFTSKVTSKFPPLVSDACRASANTVYAHLQEHGISVNIEFQIQQMRQRILRVKGLLLCLETAEPVLTAAQMLSHLVRVSRDTLSVRALIRSNTQLLAAKVTERNAEGGEHQAPRMPHPDSPPKSPWSQTASPNTLCFRPYPERTSTTGPPFWAWPGCVMPMRAYSDRKSVV